MDVNVFVPFSQAAGIVDALAALGLSPERPAAEWAPMAGVRLVGPDEPALLDLFFSLDEHYDEIARRVRRFPFGMERRTLPFLSAEDLTLFKLSFGRDKDWVDVRRLAAAMPEIDVDYVERQLIALRGPTMYPRIARLRRLIREQ